MDIGSFLTSLLMEQLQNALRELAPMITTAVVGTLTYQATALMQRQKKLQEAHASNVQLKTLTDAAHTIVLGLYEKNNAIAKDDTPRSGVAAPDRKVIALNNLKALFPDIPEVLIDDAIDAAVLAIRPAIEQGKKGE